jgi:hypothetical protein
MRDKTFPGYFVITRSSEMKKGAYEERGNKHFMPENINKSLMEFKPCNGTKAQNLSWFN